MNKIVSVMLTSALVFSSIAAMPNEAKAKTQKATVKSKSIVYKNVNKKKKLITVGKGKSVTVIKKTGSWTKVKYSKKTGYVQTKNLKFIATSKQLEKAASVKGALLLKKLTAFNALAKKGNMTAMYKASYENLSKATIEYNEYVSALKVSASVKAKLNNSYTKKAEHGLERFSEDIEAWRLLAQTANYIEKYDYTKAEIIFDEATEAYAKADVLRAEKGYAGLPGLLKTTMDDKFKSLNNRFTSSSVEQLADEGHVWIVGTNSFKWNNTKNPYINSLGTKYTNGLVTTGSNSSAKIITDVAQANGKSAFSKMTVTLSLGEYWDNEQLQKPAEVKVGNVSYYLKQGDLPIVVEVDLTELTTLEINFTTSSSVQEIGLTNIHFYR